MPKAMHSMKKHPGRPKAENTAQMPAHKMGGKKPAGAVKIAGMETAGRTFPIGGAVGGKGAKAHKPKRVVQK